MDNNSESEVGVDPVWCAGSEQTGGLADCCAGAPPFYHHVSGNGIKQYTYDEITNFTWKVEI